MFSNFAWSEMLVIAAVAIIVVGPKDLPGMLRQLGKTIGGVKRMAGDFQRQFNDAIKEADLDEIKDMTSTKGFGPLEDAKKSMEEFADSMNNPMETEAPAEVEPAIEKTEVVKAPAKKASAPKKSPAKAPTAKKAAAKKPAARKTAPKATATKKAAPKTAAKAKSAS